MPFSKAQAILKRVIPEPTFDWLYQRACNAYDIYIHAYDWLWYRMPTNHATFEQVRLVSPYTMTSREGLLWTRRIALWAVDNNIPGSFVECGVARGGCSALMALIARDEGKHRKTWLFDSFEGLPPQSELDGKQKSVRHKDRRANDLAEGYCYGSYEDVYQLLFDKLGLSRDAVIMVKGWFQDTLPDWKSKAGIAVLRLDGDWYESTKCCLENLYENVSVGGYVIIDDYSLPGCRLAVDEFIAGKHKEIKLTFDSNGRCYWVKR